MLPLLLRLPLLHRVRLHSVQELLSTFGVVDVLDPEVDSFLHVTTVDNFVADHAYRSGGYIVYDAGFAVVDC